jgi:hypothetical protein
MAITKAKLRKTRKPLDLTEERPLYLTGNRTGAVNLPKYYLKALGWIVGRTTLVITLNPDSSLNLRALPSKKKNIKPSNLPLFQPEEQKTT